MSKPEIVVRAALTIGCPSVYHKIWGNVRLAPAATRAGRYRDTVREPQDWGYSHQYMDRQGPQTAEGPSEACRLMTSMCAYEDDRMGVRDTGEVSS